MFLLAQNLWCVDQNNKVGSPVRPIFSLWIDESYSFLSPLSIGLKIVMWKSSQWLGKNIEHSRSTGKKKKKKWNTHTHTHKESIDSALATQTYLKLNAVNGVEHHTINHLFNQSTFTHFVIPRNGNAPRSTVSSILSYHRLLVSFVIATL